MPPILDAEARAEALAAMTGWTETDDRGAITKIFRFKDFNRAFGFMAQVALAAERMDHHPEWTNVFDRVSVVLRTHDAGGVTEKDIALARFMDSAAG